MTAHRTSVRPVCPDGGIRCGGIRCGGIRGGDTLVPARNRTLPDNSRHVRAPPDASRHDAGYRLHLHGVTSVRQAGSGCRHPGFFHATGRSPFSPFSRTYICPCRFAVHALDMPRTSPIGTDNASVAAGRISGEGTLTYTADRPLCTILHYTLIPCTVSCIGY